jgi:tetratricopeptide (TPR) repeat protein
MNNKVASIIAGSVLLFSSCSSDEGWFGKNFLNIPNPNQPTADLFFQSPDDAWAAVVAMYNTLLLEGTYRQWYHFDLETRSDLGYSQAGWLEFAQYPKFILYNYAWLYEVWGDNFKGIQIANKIIKKIPQIEMDEKLKKRYIAEAHFIRALYYYNITIIYGRPPLLLEPSADGQEKPKNSEPAEVYTQCIKDLEMAIPDLPWTVSDTETGRIRKGAALAQMGKTYLLLKDFGKAKLAFGEIISSGYYKLVDEYTDNFRHTNEHNSESVWEISFSNENNTDFWARYTLQHATGDRSSNYIAPVHPQVGGTSDAQPNMFYLSEFTDKTPDGKADPRRDWSIFHDTTQTWYGLNFREFKGSIDTAGGTPPKIWNLKYTNGYYETKEDVCSPINRRIIRYADVLLMYAECLNETGETSRAYEYIDMVRQRPSVNVVSLLQDKPGLTQVQMRKQIEHERIVELGGESIRWFDLLRWGYFDDPALVDTLIKRDFEFGMKPFRAGIDKYKPIPQTEMDLNPNFTQNRGW